MLLAKVGASNPTHLESWWAAAGPERVEVEEETETVQPEPVVDQPWAPDSKPLFKIKVFVPLLQVMPLGPAIIVWKS